MNCEKPKIRTQLIKVIRSQGQGSANSTWQGSETRDLRSATNNDLQERPAALQKVEQIVRSSVEKLRAGLNGQHNLMREVSGYHSACNSRYELGQWFGPFHGVSLEVHRVNCGKPKVAKTMVIRSEAKGSAQSTLERSETRTVSSASNNLFLERPTPYRGEEIVHSHTKVWGKSKPAHGNVIAQETVNGTMHLLRVLERALFYGDSSLLSLQFDGYEKLMNDNCPATNIIDRRGLPLSEDVLTDACMTASDAPNYGQITDAHMNPKVHADLVKTFFPKERHDTFQRVGDYVGLDIKGFTSPSGNVRFQPNTFINQGLNGYSATAVGPVATRPGTPTISTAATTPPHASSLFGADDAGNYWYKIVAVNRYGKSAPVDVGGGAIAVVAGDEVTWGVTPGGSTDVDYYEIFRSEVGGATGSEKLILRVNNSAGAGEETIQDLNNNLPNCTSVFLFQQNMEAMSFKQLAPMVKIPLATIDSSIRWMQLLYGVPVLYAPGKVVLIKNVGRASGYVGAP